MQFKVPQFLEIEDKIFGPFTFKEFVYLAGGAGLCFVLYRLLGLFWGGLPILAVGGFALMLTFYKPNNKPFVEMVQAGFKYVMQDKLYIWKRRENATSSGAPLLDKERVGQNSSGSGEVNTPRLGGNKLRDLAWSLDVLDLNKHENTGS